jgi:hypothetical protein
MDGECVYMSLTKLDTDLKNLFKRRRLRGDSFTSFHVEEFSCEGETVFIVIIDKSKIEGRFSVNRKEHKVSNYGLADGMRAIIGK